MDISFENIPLVRFVQSKDEPLYQDLLKLKKNTERWLSYVPTTFAHYPSHGADHSEEIVRKMSEILFKDGDINQPAASELNEVEAAILIAAAYTHDVGMVVSEKAKEDLLRSKEWTEYISQNKDAKDDWDKTISIMENEQQELNEHERLYIASRLQRWLITEFFRRGHAMRSGNFLRFNPNVFGADCLKVRQFRDAVAKVAEGHGIGYRELENDHEYPEDGTIMMSPVNIRFLAIIMRFGDLLDMRSERSDTTYRSLTSIPEESVPHWDQYEDFRNEVTTTEKIGLSAYCPTQESYRVLRAWCSWIEQESREATIVMKRAKRHSDWTPPKVKVAPAEGNTTSDDTIFIEPSPGASYVPHDWKFHFDRDLVIQRLAVDVYKNNDSAFIRELIQNSLDATRARLSVIIEDLTEEKVKDTYKIDSTHIDFFPITISLNDIDTEEGHVQSITISDRGVGMNEYIIKRYFLQIGQSYYTSEEFRSKYDFKPTSQFGIGFLSVFGVSNRIEISTLRYDKKNPALKLTLTSPNDYLLTERCHHRTKPGTSIKVFLKKRFEHNEFKKYVQALTEGTEIPIHVNIEETESKVIKHEIKEDQIPASFSRNESFTLKVHNIESDHGHGQIGLWYLNNNKDKTLSYKSSYIEKYSKAADVPLESKRFYHGISTRQASIGHTPKITSNGKLTFWFNQTSDRDSINASRYNINKRAPTEIKELVEKLLEEDLNSYNQDTKRKYISLDGLESFVSKEFIYRQKLIRAFSVKNQKETLLSINDLWDLKITVVNDNFKKENNENTLSIALKNSTTDENEVLINTEEVHLFNQHKYLDEIEIISSKQLEGIYLTHIKPRDESKNDPKPSIKKFEILEVENCHKLLSPVLDHSRFFLNLKFGVFNSLHPLGQWLKEIQESSDISSSQIDFINSQITRGFIGTSDSYVNTFKKLERDGFIPSGHPLPSINAPWEGHDLS